MAVTQAAHVPVVPQLQVHRTKVSRKRTKKNK